MWGPPQPPSHTHCSISFTSFLSIPGPHHPKCSPYPSGSPSKTAPLLPGSASFRPHFSHPDPEPHFEPCQDFSSAILPLTCPHSSTVPCCPHLAGASPTRPGHLIGHSHCLKPSNGLPSISTQFLGVEGWGWGSKVRGGRRTRNLRGAVSCGGPIAWRVRQSFKLEEGFASALPMPCSLICPTGRSRNPAPPSISNLSSHSIPRGGAPGLLHGLHCLPSLAITRHLGGPLGRHCSASGLCLGLHLAFCHLVPPRFLSQGALFSSHTGPNWFGPYKASEPAHKEQKPVSL